MALPLNTITISEKDREYCTAMGGEQLAILNVLLFLNEVYKQKHMLSEMLQTNFLYKLNGLKIYTCYAGEFKMVIHKTEHYIYYQLD